MVDVEIPDGRVIEAETDDPQTDSLAARRFTVGEATQELEEQK
jgi:hypothetical protein